MPQARLPDINTAFNFHRGKAITLKASGNYVGAIGSLYAFNNCLQKDYQIKISTKEFNDKVNLDKEVLCNNCEKQLKHKDIKVYQLLNASQIVMLSGMKYTNIWKCPLCHQDNKLENTRFIQKVLAKPYRIKIVPEPPMRLDGIANALEYEAKFDSWFWQFLDELEAAAAQFRDDNWQKADALGNMDHEINTDDEEET